MKQIPKYEYFLIRSARYAEYMDELVTELNNTICLMAANGWQTDGPHQTLGRDKVVHVTQMMKRFHSDYLAFVSANTLNKDVIVVE